MTDIRKISRVSTARTLLAILGLLVLFGCQTMSMGGKKSLETTAAMPTVELAVAASQAYANQRYAQSEWYYSLLAERPDLDPKLLPTVYLRLSESALEEGHPHQAQMSLDTLSRMAPGIETSPDFMAMSLRSAFALRQPERVAAIQDQLLNDNSLDWETRSRGGVMIASLLSEQGKADEGLDTLHRFYDMAPGMTGKAALEHDFQARLGKMEDLRPLLARVTAVNRHQFPYALVAFEDARRRAEDEDQWAGAWKDMRSVLAKADLADKIFLGDLVMDLERGKGQPRMGVVLALPITGRYGDVGRKIVRGAGAAQWELANLGIEVEVKVVNTDAPRWSQRLEYLAGQYPVLGGPLRVSAFKELKAQGGLDGHAVFAFMPGLGQTVEGQEAWRFFPSRGDEVSALVRMAMDGLAVRDFAVLHPEEDFGHKMSALFQREVIARGGSIKGTASYPTKDHPQWGRRIAKLLGVPADFDKEAPLPSPKFGAVFLPDGWSQAQLLVPNFFYYDAADMVFLGTDLWSRALDEVKEVEMNYFKLAVCPGAWWAESPGAQALQVRLDQDGLGKADFWVALGYDFLRFASRMGSLGSTATSSTVNARIGQALPMDFSMAPVSFDENGVATQQLYVFRPAEEGGKVLADPETLQQAITRAKNRRAKRVQAWREQQGR